MTPVASSMRTKGHAPPISAMVAAVPAASCGPSISSARGSSSASDWSVSNPYMLVVLRLLPSGLAMTPLAEMARSAKKRLESRPETREVIEKETSLVEARSTPAMTGTSDRYTGSEKIWPRKSAESAHVKSGSSVFTTLVKATVPG